MPAIGASTTGVSTRSGPRVRPGVTELGRGMRSLSGAAGWRPKSGSAAAGPALAARRALARTGLRRLVPLHVSGPGDRVEGLLGPEAHRDQVAVVEREVDQADARC